MARRTRKATRNAQQEAAAQNMNATTATAAVSPSAKSTVVRDSLIIKQKDNNAIKYSGVVQITINHGNRPIKTITCHNSGGISLFNFIHKALIAQTFNEITTLRPAKLLVLTTMTQHLPEPGEEGWPDDEWPGWLDTSLVASNSIGFNKTLKCNHTGEELDFRGKSADLNCTCSLHFMVPYTAIAGNGDFISGFVLLNNEDSTSIDALREETDLGYSPTLRYFAFLPLTEPIQINEQDIRKNFNIAIDWTITFKN